MLDCLTELSSVARVTGAAEGVDAIHTLSIATIHSNTVISLITVCSSEIGPGTLCAARPLEVLSTQHSDAQIHGHKAKESGVVLSF